MEKGEQGEYDIIKLLRQYGITKIRIPDIVWLHPETKKWFYCEIKNKAPFQPPPDWLQGFPQSQFIKDVHIDAAGLTAIYIVRGKNGGWLAQYANLLQPIPNAPNANQNEDLVWFRISDFIPLERFFVKFLMLEKAA